MIWGTTHQQDFARRLNLTYWHRWFAWHVVMLDNGRFVWLQFVHRRLECGVNYDGPYTNKYYQEVG